MNRAPRAELTAREKIALGKLLHGPLTIAPADPRRSEFDALCNRGGWVELLPDGRYSLTRFGHLAFYTAKIVRKVSG